MTEQVKKSILERLQKSYEHFKYPASLQFPVLTVAHVVNFAEQTRRRITELAVNGYFSQDEMTLALRTKKSITRALE